MRMTLSTLPFAASTRKAKETVALQNKIAYVRLLIAGALAGFVISGAFTWAIGFSQSHWSHAVGAVLGVAVAASYKMPHARAV